MPTAIEKYKAGIRRRKAEDRRDTSMRVERAAHRIGLILGLIAAPWTTMGIKVGPVPISGIAAAGALLIDLLVFPEGAFWVGALGIVEGLGAADLTNAVAAARVSP